ncbi:hypothetical protein HDU78_009083 [Chytriomyces hyalinus]|nr:hypothetical protein HDU78_009083 [Chytriomyces hyalinus]
MSSPSETALTVLVLKVPKRYRCSVPDCAKDFSTRQHNIAHRNKTIRKRSCKRNVPNSTTTDAKTVFPQNSEMAVPAAPHMSTTPVPASPSDLSKVPLLLHQVVTVQCTPPRSLSPCGSLTAHENLLASTLAALCSQTAPSSRAASVSKASIAFLLE